jgi:hypothetical protein
MMTQKGEKKLSINIFDIEFVGGEENGALMDAMMST